MNATYKRMKRIIVVVALMAQLPAMAQNFTLDGVINNKSYDGLYMYLRRVAVTNNREAATVDSAVMKDGRFHFSLTATAPYMARLALPEKDSVHHFLYGLPETECVVEPDARVTLTFDAADPYSTTLTGGHINADYDATVLAANRLCRQQTSQMMRQRQEDEQKAPYTDAQNEAYSKRLTAIYAAMKPATLAFVRHNIGNDFGATSLFAGGPDYFGQAVFDSLAQKVRPALLAAYNGRVAREKAELEQELKARDHNRPGVDYTDFVSKTADGRTVRLSDYLKPGRILLVDFWASWCVPCQMEIPHIKDLYRQWHDKGLDVISVSLDTKRPAWEKAIDRNKMPWPQLSTLEGFSADAAKAYAVSAIPFVILIDQQGRLALVNMHGDVLDKKIAELLQ